MSKPLKVYVRPDAPAYSRPKPLGGYTQPAIQVPIDDESLPHPNDGKQWEWEEDPVEIVSPVFVGGHWIAVAMQPGKELRIAPVCDLRERKPEHEHETPTVEDAIRIAEKMHGVTRIRRMDSSRAIRFRHCGRSWRCVAVTGGFLVEEAGDGFLRSNEDALEIEKTMESLWSECERRSGEDRREGERRIPWPYSVSVMDRREHETCNRRSGTDRRRSP